MSKPIEVALDTCVVLDLADEDGVTIASIKTIRKRLSDCQIIVLPTVIQELNAISINGDRDERELALRALLSIRGTWKFRPVNCIPVGHGIVFETARKIRIKGLIPDEEVNDSFIVAEAGLLDVSILLSNDGHIKNIDYDGLKLLLASCDLSCPLIASPRKIVAMFAEK